MNKNITSPNGLKLLTAGKYCAEDIQVIPVLQEKATTENGDIVADSGYAGLSKVTVNVASGAELNIAYGDTAPEDTTKLWVNGAEPSKVIATNQMNGSETLSLVNAHLPNNIYATSSAKVGNFIYTFGGTSSMSSSSSYYKSTICKFNTTTETIETLSTYLPAPLCATCCASVGTDIYIFGGVGYIGGFFYQNTIYKFDTTTETITTLETTLPVKLYEASCAIVGNNIYIFGGMYRGSSSSARTSAIYKFNTITETITTLSTTLPKSLTKTSCASVGTDIYIFGGERDTTIYYDAIYKFDTTTETITTLSATLPNTMGYTCCVSIGTNIYIFGGGNNSTYYNTVCKFDTTIETLATLSATLPKALWGASGASVGTNIYIFGGYSSSVGAINTIYDFTVSVDLPANQLLLNTTLTKNLFKIINAPSAEIEIGVNGVYRGNANGIAELETANIFDTNQYAWVDIQSGAVVEKLASVVTITSQASEYAFNVYDGTNTSGNLVATLGGANGVLTAKVPCFSGYLYFQNTNASTAWEGFTVASNMTVTGGTDNYQLVQVNGDGAISATVVEVSAGFTVSMSTSGQNATVYDGQTATGTGVTITYSTAKEVICTSGYLLVTFATDCYYSTGYDITGSITGQTITYSGSGYNNVALLFTVGSDGSILNISVSID